MNALIYRSRLSIPETIKITKYVDMKQFLGSQFTSKPYPKKPFLFIAFVPDLEVKNIKNYNRWNVFGAFIVFRSKQKEFIEFDTLSKQDIAELIKDDIHRQTTNQEAKMLLDEHTSVFASVILNRKTYERGVDNNAIETKQNCANEF